MDQLKFTLTEALAMIGVIQCVYVLVHVSFRAQGNFTRVLLPLLYFFVLGVAFFLDMARSFISAISDYYEIFTWMTWMATVPLGVLLIIQMAHIVKLPKAWNWMVLLVIPLAYAISSAIVLYGSPSCAALHDCEEFIDWLNITGMCGGGISLLFIWFNRDLFENIRNQKAGKERYWLVLSLVILNAAFLAVLILHTSALSEEINIVLLREILGLSFVYLVSTSLLRIYPLALFDTAKVSDNELTDEEKRIAERIESLIKYEKIYHEAGYSRSDLAKELGIPDSAVSRIINLHYKKSFPQLLNEYRIEDAKQLLLDTDVTMNIIAQEVGFNSLPSFNRVFRDIEKQSPSSYRKNTIK